MEHCDVFISHAEEDGEIALGLAKALREQGQTTWVYEEDAVPGISHLIQSSEAIEACRTFLLVASPNSVQSPEVIREVEHAHQHRKVIVPVRVGLTQEQFTASSRIVQMATGTAVTLSAEANDLAAVAIRIAGSTRVTGRTAPSAAVNVESESLESRSSAFPSGGRFRSSFASTPVQMLRRAILAVPAVKYALAVAGLLVAVALAGSLVVGGTTSALLASCVIVVLMIVLVMFAKSVATTSRAVMPAMLFLTWSISCFVISSSALVVLSVFFNWPKPIEEVRLFGVSSGATPVQTVLSTPHAELIALLEIRVQNILARMDADVVATVKIIRSGIGMYERLSLQEREEAIQTFTQTAQSQRQLFLDLHRRHVDALKVNQPIVAHEIIGDMYHLLWLQANQKNERAIADAKANLEKVREKAREKLPKHVTDALELELRKPDQLIETFPERTLGDFVEDYPALSPNASEMEVEPERLQRILALIESMRSR